jgi:16S rRNA (guanine(966)-N(2))-methyltransferase RsmD
LRIVGGKYKGRVLNTFNGKDIRPTSDMVRESLFNILQFKIYGATFLDLFCGTGAMGIEALSRGASKVVFNDASKDSVALLIKNIEKCKIEEEYEVKNRDAIVLLDTIGEQFDFIYIDPPYSTDLGERALNRVANCLTEDGVAIFEDEREFDKKIDGLTVVDKRKYGRAYLTFFKKEN